MSKRAIVVLAVIWLIILVAGVSSSLTLMLCRVGGDSDIAFAGAHIVSSSEYAIIQRYSRLQEVMDVIERDYYIPVDEDKLLLGAIDGMTASLGDPYTFYYTPQAMQETTEHQSGSYEGIGIHLLTGEDGQLIVIRAFTGSPAQKAGIRSGDILLEVDGESVNGENVSAMDRAVSAIKGELHTFVNLTLRRGEEIIRVDVERDAVTMDRVEYRMLDDGIGYIAIFEFMGNDVELFKAALKDLTAQGMQGLVLDIRSNPGGLLTDVVEIADLLLPEGLTVYTQDRSGKRESYYSDKEALGIPLVVLINGTSASASEILAGAVQDYGVGTLVGTNSFGKGIVQTIMTFRDDGAGMQLTTSSYYTPSGRSIHGTGIAPDVVVETDEWIYASIAFFTGKEDPQLEKALEILRKKLKL